MRSITKEDWNRLSEGDILYSLNAQRHFEVKAFVQDPLHGRVPLMAHLNSAREYDIIAPQLCRLARWAKRNESWVNDIKP